MTSTSPAGTADTVRGDGFPSPAMDQPPPGGAARRAFILRLFLLLLVSAAITLTMQVWVGSVTIYAADIAPRRERLHELILHNVPPASGHWADLGANSTNIRVGAVYLAEAIHRITGLPVMRAYWLMDTLALFVAFPLVVLVYQRIAGRIPALLAMLYIAAILPLTYVLHYFHPWDRLALILWITMIGLVRADRPIMLAVVLAISMVVKFDALLLPGLYFLVHARRHNLGPVVARTAALFAVTFGTYAGLRLMFPGGSQLADTATQVATNLREILEYNIGYPPLLGLSVPVLLGIVGWRRADRFARACTLFATGLVAIYFANSNFAELRSMTPVLLLLIPVAVNGLTVILPVPPDPATPGHSPVR